MLEGRTRTAAKDSSASGMPKIEPRRKHPYDMVRWKSRESKILCRSSRPKDGSESSKSDVSKMSTLGRGVGCGSNTGQVFYGPRQATDDFLLARPLRTWLQDILGRIEGCFGAPIKCMSFHKHDKNGSAFGKKSETPCRWSTWFDSVVVRPSSSGA